MIFDCYAYLKDARRSMHRLMTLYFGDWGLETFYLEIGVSIGEKPRVGGKSEALYFPGHREGRR